jgi:hypothetical protein
MDFIDVGDGNRAFTLISGEIRMERFPPFLALSPVAALFLTAEDR